MRARTSFIVGLVGLTALGTAVVAAERKVHRVSPSKDGNLVVGLCDGETSAEVDGVKPGETLSHEKAQAVSDQLMKSWREKNPNARWDATPSQVAMAAPPENKEKSVIDRVRNTAAGKPYYKKDGGEAREGKPDGGLSSSTETSRGGTDTYQSFTERDEQIWKASTQQFVQQGREVFHDAKQLGGTVGISCDMCHPDAANTHPETYPKYQTQLGRVAMLRDMINWCIENPVRGKPLADDDERMKAIEAYILAQRKGTPLEYGKH